MKKNLFYGLLVILMIFCFIGCDNGSDNSYLYIIRNNMYKLTWGTWLNTTYSNVSADFTAAGVPLITAGTNAGYLTGVNASDAFNYIITAYNFDDGGIKTGLYENLLNFKIDGIGAPQEMKTIMLVKKNNAPVGGVFQVTVPGVDNFVVIFYIEKI